jgi:hypothetical protein
LIEAQKNILTSINRKISFTTLTSRSQQNKRIKSLAKDIEEESQAILKRQNFDNTKIRYIELEIGDEVVGIDLSKVNLDFTRIRQDAIVRACDEALISRDGYRNLAAINPNLEREYQISNRRNDISKYMKTIIPIYDCKIELNNFNNSSIDLDSSLTNNQSGLCSYRTIKDLLNILIPIWKKTSILSIENNIKLKFGGDGHIVTNKYSHVVLFAFFGIFY